MKRKTRNNKKNTNNTKKNKKSHKQKLYNMKGCSKTLYKNIGGGNPAYPNTTSEPYTQKFINPTIMKGGNKAFVSTPWAANTTSWPGVSGVSSGNYYSNNTYDTDVSRMLQDTQHTQYGGKRNRKTKKNKKFGKNKKNKYKKRGGGFSNFFSQDLINVGRNAVHNVHSTVNGFEGKTMPTNPMPWQGQFPHSTMNLKALLT